MLKYPIETVETNFDDIAALQSLRGPLSDERPYRTPLRCNMKRGHDNPKKKQLDNNRSRRNRLKIGRLRADSWSTEKVAWRLWNMPGARVVSSPRTDMESSIDICQGSGRGPTKKVASHPTHLSEKRMIERFMGSPICLEVTLLNSLKESSSWLFVCGLDKISFSWIFWQNFSYQFPISFFGRLWQHCCTQRCTQWFLQLLWNSSAPLHLTKASHWYLSLRAFKRTV